MLKKIISICLALAVLVTPAFAFSTTVTGKTIMGPNYMMFGTFTGATTTAAHSITTGLSSIRAFGVYTNTTTRDAMTATPSAGTLSVRRLALSITGSLTPEALADGYWFAIGK